MIFSTADITAMLGALGEPVILHYRSARRSVTAVYERRLDPGSPIDGIPAQDVHLLTCAADDVADIGVGWSAFLRGRIRPVLQVSETDGSGFAVIVLGDISGGCA